MSPDGKEGMHVYSIDAPRNMIPDLAHWRGLVDLVGL
jgi:hypothetical protein